MAIQNITQSIRQHIPLSEDELAPMLALFTMRSLQRNEYILTQGQVCDFVAYIHHGVAVYLKDDNGDEKAIDFALDGDWVTNNQSRLGNSPSTINIKVIEPTQMLVVSSSDVHQCYDIHPMIERLSRLLIEEAFVKMVYQHTVMQTLSATERYHHLVTTRPQLIQRVPLYHIASYLGIAPKSLSRIRAKIAGK